MLLYWGIFTVGFLVGVGLVLVVFKETIFSARAQEFEENLDLQPSLEEVPQLH